MTDEITILVNGRPVTPTPLWRVLLPLAWLPLGFMALSFLFAFLPAWGWILIGTIAVIWFLAHHGGIDWEYDENGYSEKYDRWRGE